MTQMRRSWCNGEWRKGVAWLLAGHRLIRSSRLLVISNECKESSIH